MSARAVVVATDDLYGGPADREVCFGIDGMSWVMDLNEANAASLEADLAPFIAAARIVRKPHRASRRTIATRRRAAETRSWWKSHPAGLPSWNEGGRLPLSVIRAYEARELRA